MTGFRRRRKVGASTTRSVPRVASTLAWRETVGIFRHRLGNFRCSWSRGLHTSRQTACVSGINLAFFLVKGDAMFTDTLSKLHLRAVAPVTLQTVREAARRVRVALCALHGHDLLLHFERGRRVCLRCTIAGTRRLAGRRGSRHPPADAGESHERRTRSLDDLSGAAPCQPVRRRRIAADRRSGRGAPAGGCRMRRRGDAVAVRGADHRPGDWTDPSPRSAQRAVRQGAVVLPQSGRLRARAGRVPRAAPQDQGCRLSAGDRVAERSRTPRPGCSFRGRWKRRAPMRSS